MNRENYSADVVVIGAGIVGCAIAYRLAQESLSVSVVEARTPGCEASGAAAGILAAQAEADSADDFLKLCLYSRAQHARLAEQLQAEVDMDVEHRASGLLFAAFCEAEAAELQERYRWQQRAHLPVEALSGSQARKLEPLLAPQAEFTLLFPEDGRVNNVRLTQALSLAAARRGVRFFTGRPARQILGRAHGVCTVATGEESWQAPWVVNAAGAWSGALDQEMSYALPVKPVRGQMAAVQSPNARLQRVLYSPRGYLVPRVDGRILIGSTMENAGYDKRVTVEGLCRVLNVGVEIAPEIAAATVVETWAGLRPCTDDRLPVIGLSETPGLILATGHCRNGILLAPVTAELVRDLILSGRPSLPVESLTPARFRLNSSPR